MEATAEILTINPAPLIVTLKLDAGSAAALNELRQAHFPAERNFLDAHVTLFHALPGTSFDFVREALEAVCGETAAAFPVLLSKVRFTGRGVAIDAQSAELLRIRKRLAAIFDDSLTPQDRQGYRPHVTIQNKATPEAARALHAQLAATGTPQTAHALGLDLYYYRGGPWEFVATFPFAISPIPNA